jgi:hypothetical protein
VNNRRQVAELQKTIGRLPNAPAPRAQTHHIHVGDRTSTQSSAMSGKRFVPVLRTLQKLQTKQKETVVIIIVHHSQQVQVCAAPLGDGSGSSQLLIAIGTLIFIQ